jgi:hypothetical protein
MTDRRIQREPRIKWTPELEQTLRDRYPHERTENIARDLGISIAKCYAKASSMRLSKTPEYLASPDACRLRRGGNIGAESRFKPGQKSWNKGTHFTAGGRSAETRFKKGHKHNTETQIGALRINADGYLERKTSMTHPVPARRWVAVHRLVWIEANGPLPEGHIVVFKPGMRTAVEAEITLDKVELISRIDNMKRNSYHNYPKEVAKLIQLRGAVQRQINRRLKDGQPDQNE